MALRVSTTGANVPLNDLGIEIVHPTVNRDLADEFPSQELKESEDLTLAIQNGDLTVDDGQFVIAGTDYSPSEAINQELGLKSDDRFISHNELQASNKDTEIVSGVFPLALNSTALVTKNVYSPNGKWGTWSLAPGDIVVISGSTAADGTYTVDSVSDAQNFIVVESIANSTGGTVTVYHPAASNGIGVDDTNFVNITGTNLQAVLDSIDDNIGLGGGGGVYLEDEGSSVSGGPHTTLNFTGAGVNVTDQGGGEANISIPGFTNATHRDLDQLVHNIAEDSFKEYVYSGNKVTSVIAWTDNGKTTKIRESQFVYTGIKIQSITVIQYDNGGVEVERLTKTFNYTGNKLTSIDEVLS